TERPDGQRRVAAYGDPPRCTDALCPPRGADGWRPPRHPPGVDPARGVCAPAPDPARGEYINGMRFRTAIFITLFVLAICLAIALIVFWNIYIIRGYLTIRDLHTELHGTAKDFSASGRWIVLSLGIAAGVVLIVALSLFFAAVMRNNILKRQQRDFTNMMTHELRLPLAGIQIFAQTLRQRPLEVEERDRFADGILAECTRLGLLIDQLLKIQQFEHGQLLLHKQTLDAAVLARDFAAKWPRPLVLACEDGLSLEADPLLLDMSLANLVSNAEKY